MTKTLVELQDVRKGYQFGDATVSALDGVSLQIGAGSFVAVIGRSGSGKSTLLNLLGGLDRPSQGQILVDGQPLLGRSSDDLASYRREMVGFVFQSFNLIPHLTALENVALPLALAGRSPGDRRKLAQSLLERVGLGARMGHRPAEMSGGERQRVAIARALVNEPRLLLADEPTGNLDSKTAEEIMSMLQELHREGRTIVLVTHDAERAERYCERMVILSDGKVQEDRPGGAASPAADSPAPPAAEPDPDAEPDAGADEASA